MLGFFAFSFQNFLDGQPDWVLHVVTDLIQTVPPWKSCPLLSLGKKVLKAQLGVKTPVVAGPIDRIELTGHSWPAKSWLTWLKR
jgi:hypothetical protein